MKFQLCVGYLKGKKDFCIGDSGGLLFCLLLCCFINWKWYVNGVISYGEGVGRNESLEFIWMLVNFIDGF